MTICKLMLFLIIIVSMQKKTKLNKHNLHIQIPLSQQRNKMQESQFDVLYVRPIYSAKNKHKTWSKITFDEHLIQAPVKSIKEKRLEKDNEFLLSSIVALKTGAVSAIAQKQQEIEKLRSGFEWQQQLRAIQQQVQDLYHERRQLKEQIKELQSKLQSQRQSYLRMLQQKERVLEQLYNELNSTQFNIQNLQKSLEVKDKKIKIIEQENTQLLHQLSQFELQRISHIGHSTLHSQNNESDCPQFPPPIQQDSSQSNVNSKQIIPPNDLQTEKKMQLQLKHKQDMHQLSNFYQKKIADMRELYDRQLFAPTTQQNFNHISGNQNDQQLANSYRGTQVDPKKLSYELINFPKLNECFSVTKRNSSQVDRFSIFTGQKQPINEKNVYEAKQNTKIKMKQESQPSTNKRQKKNSVESLTSTKITNESVCNSQAASKFNLGSFLMGATAGGVATALLCKWINL